MRAQIADERGIAACGLLQSGGVLRVGEELDARFLQERRLGRQRAIFLVFAGELLGFDLAGFDVGLIERVDADDRAGHGRRDFPAEKFLAQVVDIRHGDADDRLAGLFERVDGSVLLRIGRAVETQIGEHAIVAINVRRARCCSRSTGIRPLPSLPVDSARSCSSQAPRSEMPGEVKIVTLSRPLFCACPESRRESRRDFRPPGRPKRRRGPSLRCARGTSAMSIP